MLDKLRELERLLEPGQNDYFSALRERIHPIKGKASLGEELQSTLEDYERTSISDKESYGDGFSYGNGYGDGWGDLEALFLQEHAIGDNIRSPEEDGGDGWGKNWWLNGDG